MLCAGQLDGKRFITLFTRLFRADKLLLYTQFKETSFFGFLAHKPLETISWKKICILKGRLVIRARNGMWKIQL